MKVIGAQRSICITFCENYVCSHRLVVLLLSMTAHGLRFVLVVICLLIINLFLTIYFFFQSMATLGSSGHGPPSQEVQLVVMLCNKCNINANYLVIYSCTYILVQLFLNGSYIWALSPEAFNNLAIWLCVRIYWQDQWGCLAVTMSLEILHPVFINGPC